MLAVDAATATASLATYTAGLREAAAAEQAEVATSKALQEQLAQEAAAAVKAAEAAAVLAAARKKMETIAAASSPSAKLALDHKREWEELSKLAQVTQDASLSQKAAAATAARQAAELQKLGGATETLTASTKGTSGSMVNLVRNLNDVAVMASMGANPLQILATQGEQVAFALKEAGGASAVFARVSAAIGPAMAVAGPAIAVVAVAAAAAAAAYSVFGNAMADVEERARSAGPALDSLVSASKDAEEAAKNLSGAWGDVSTKIKDAQRELDTIAGKLGKGESGAMGEIDKLGSSKANEALLADAKRMVTARQALTEAIRRQSAGDAEAGAQVAALRQEYNDANKTLEEHKKQYQTLELALWGVGVATDAKTEADKNAKDAAKGLNEELRRQEQIARLMDQVNKRAATGMTEEAEAAANAKMEIEKLQREADKLGVTSDKLAPAIKAINDELRTKLNDIGIRKAGEAFDALPIEVLRTNAALDDFRKSMDELVPASTLTDLEKLQMIQADLAISLSRNAVSADEYAEAMKEASKASTNAAVSNAATTVGQYSSANGILNTVSNAGPWGALIAGIIDAIRNLKDTFSGINDLLTSVLSTIGDLPSIIGDEIATLLDTLPKQLGAAIGGFVGELPTLIVDIVKMILSPVFWIKVLTSFIDGLVNGLLKALGFDTRINLTGEVDKVKGSASDTKRGYASERSAYMNARTATTSGGYGFRPATWTGTAVTRGMGATGGASVRMGGRNGKVTLEIDESTYADVHKGLKKRGVIA